MSVDATTERFEAVTVFGIPMIFTNLRIKRSTVPEGCYAYDVRHDDECQGIPVQIKEFVMVNHWGTIISSKPLDLIDNDGTCRYVDEESDWNYEGYTVSLAEYLKEEA